MIAKVEDLSSRHHPVGNLLRRPADRAEWDRHRLSDDSKWQFFQRTGIL